jgi:hypothetical protein
MKQQD